jgi:hypothetical protein
VSLRLPRGPDGLAAAAALAAASLLPLGACRSASAPAAAPRGLPSMSLGEAPPEFQSMRASLVRLGRARDAADAATARSLHPHVLAAARELLAMGPPHDLTRQRVARFLEGRGSFGDAVNAYDRAVLTEDDAALWRSVSDLEGTFRGWHDAYRGRPSEGGV